MEEGNVLILVCLSTGRRRYGIEGVAVVYMVYPEINKFEQVSSDGHQLSIAGGTDSVQRSYVSGEWGVQCIMSNCHIGPHNMNRQTDTTKNIMSPQLRWRAQISSSTLFANFLFKHSTIASFCPSLNDQGTRRTVSFISTSKNIVPEKKTYSEFPRKNGSMLVNVHKRMVKANETCNVFF